MFLSDIVNLFIGLALVFGTVALAASAITEGISSILAWRSDNLLTGLKDLLNDKDLQGLAGDILNHGATNPRGPGDLDPAKMDRWSTPSYIAPQQFASALIDILQNLHKPNLESRSLTSGIAALGGGQSPNTQLQTMLTGMLSRADSDVQKFHKSVAEWFDRAMDRVGGRYKRTIQIWSFLAAFAVALSLNLDTFTISRVLWSHPNLTTAIHLDDFSATADAGSKAKQATNEIAALQKADFPFGWDLSADGTDPHAIRALPQSFCGSIIKLLGLIATATAALFGSPFWFDLLKQFVQLRGAGTAPGKKQSAAPQ